MKKIISIFILFFVSSSIFVAADEIDRISNEVVEAFQRNDAEGIYNHFYIPPYFVPEDIEKERKLFGEILIHFQKYFGDLESYSDIDVSEVKSEFGIGLAGYNEDDFLTRKDLGLYVKTYKTNFTDAQNIYLYVYLMNHQENYYVTQLGVAFTEEGGSYFTDKVMSLMMVVEQLTCTHRGRKQRFLADELFGENDRCARYKLVSEEKKLIQASFCYGSTYSIKSPKSVRNELLGHDEAFEEEEVYNVVTQKGEKIKFIFKDEFNMRVETPKREQDIEEILSVETKEGFVIDYKVLWKNGEMASFRMEPKIHPFAAGAIAGSPCNNK